jgi:hypothetical protein
MDREPRIDISLLELLGILRIATRYIEPGVHGEPRIPGEPKKRIATEFVLALNRGGHIDKKITKEIIESINPELREPGKIVVATRTVPYWWPEELGANGLMWRDQKNS